VPETRRRELLRPKADEAYPPPTRVNRAGRGSPGSAPAHPENNHHSTPVVRSIPRLFPRRGRWGRGAGVSPKLEVFPCICHHSMIESLHGAMVADSSDLPGHKAVNYRLAYGRTRILIVAKLDAGPRGPNYRQATAPSELFSSRQQMTQCRRRLVTCTSGWARGDAYARRNGPRRGIGQAGRVAGPTPAGRARKFDAVGARWGTWHRVFEFCANNPTT
jgi:hypothetical protein